MTTVMTSFYNRNIKIIDGFKDDLEVSSGGFGRVHYLDPMNDEDDRKWMLGIPTTQFSGGRLYVSVDRVDGMRDVEVYTPVIYKDVLDKWLDSIKEDSK